MKRFFINNPTEQLSDPREESILYEFIEKKLIENKIYLNPNMTLKAFSKEIDLNPKKVSSTIQSKGYKSFNSFLNAFRISLFKECVILKKFENYTLIGIALECGFNSKSTFYRAFKEEEGMTPNQYLKSL